MLIRGCHAPVLVRQGTAEMRHRAPTYRERWVKNDGSGTLGYFGNQRSPRFLGLRFCMLCMHPLALPPVSRRIVRANGPPILLGDRKSSPFRESWCDKTDIRRN